MNYWAAAFSVVSRGKSHRAGCSGTELTSLSNVSGWWGARAALGSLVPGPGQGGGGGLGWKGPTEGEVGRGLWIGQLSLGLDLGGASVQGSRGPEATAPPYRKFKDTVNTWLTGNSTHALRQPQRHSDWPEACPRPGPRPSLFSHLLDV